MTIENDQVCRAIRHLFQLAVLFSLITLTSICWGRTLSVTVTAPGLIIPQYTPVLLQAIDLSNGKVISSNVDVVIDLPAIFSLESPGKTPEWISVKLIDVANKQLYYGNSQHALPGKRKPADETIDITVEIQTINSLSSASRLAASLPFTMAQAAPPKLPGIIKLTVPDNAFTLTTDDAAFDPMKKGEGDMVITDLVSSDCQKSNLDSKQKPAHTIEVYETGSKFMQAREVEKQLCRSQLADKSTCPKSWPKIKPTHSIGGSVNVSGGQVTINIQMKDSKGNVVLESSATGSVDDYFSVHEQAIGDLNSKICGGKIQITGSSCPSSVCSQDPLMVIYQPQMTGIAQGDVGAKVVANTSPALGGTISCSNWTVKDCSPITCCEREEGQPDMTTFTAAQPLFCLPPFSWEMNFVAQLRKKKNSIEKQKSQHCE